MPLWCSHMSASSWWFKVIYPVIFKKDCPMCMLCLYVCMYSSCMHDGCRGRRGLGISWNWSSRQLWTTMWVLWTELSTFESAGSAFNCWVFSLVPHCNHFCVCSRVSTLPSPCAQTPNLPFSGWLFSLFIEIWSWYVLFKKDEEFTDMFIDSKISNYTLEV